MSSTTPPEILRDGPYLVVRQHWVELPAGCVICGAAESGRLRLKIRKASKLCALLGYFGIFIYFIMPAAFLHVGLCDEHRADEQSARRLIRISLGSALVSILISIYFASPEAIQLGVAVAVLLITLTGLYEIARHKLLVAIHSDPSYVWLANVSPSILSQFPEVAAQADSAAPRGTS
jgi:hypothetical protein